VKTPSVRLAENAQRKARQLPLELVILSAAEDLLLEFVILSAAKDLLLEFVILSEAKDLLLAGEHQETRSASGRAFRRAVTRCFTKVPLGAVNETGGEQRRSERNPLRKHLND